MPNPVIDISITSPFTLRDLEGFISDARNNGFKSHQTVTVSHIHRGEYDRQVEDTWGNPTPVIYTGLSLNSEEQE